MTERVRPPLTLAWNPLVFVLGQVVTSPVLRIEDYIPELQERFRKNGYPGFNRVETQNVRVGAKGALDVANETRWILSSKDLTRSVVVGPGAVVLQCTEYGTFDDFVAELRDVLALFNEVVDVALYQRLGLRRINLFEHSDALPIDEIVQEGLRGLAGDVFSEDHEQRVEHWGNTPAGRLMVRLLRPAPETVVTPDLDTTGLVLREPRVSGRETAMLDIDHFRIGQAEFSPESVVDQFWLLHDASDQAFRESVTERAIAMWEQGDPYDA